VVGAEQAAGLLSPPTAAHTKQGMTTPDAATMGTQDGAALDEGASQSVLEIETPGHGKAVTVEQENNDEAVAVVITQIEENVTSPDQSKEQ